MRLANRAISKLTVLSCVGVAGFCALLLIRTASEASMKELPFGFRTVCAGSLDLDIPVHFILRFESVVLDGFVLETSNVDDQSAYREAVIARQSDLRSGVVDDSGEETQLRWARVDGDVTTLATDVVRDLPELMPDGYRVEASLWRDGMVFNLSGFIPNSDEAQRLENLRRITNGLRVGAGPGLCLEGGHLAGRLDWQVVEIFIHDPGLRGYGMTLSVAEGPRAPSEIANPSRTLSLTARSRTIAGQPGFEERIVHRGETGRDDGVAIRYMAFAGRGARAGEPYVTITAQLFKDAASADAPPYNVETSAALWDRLLSSARPRR